MGSKFLSSGYSGEWVEQRGSEAVTLKKMDGRNLLSCLGTIGVGLALSVVFFIASVFMVKANTWGSFMKATGLNNIDGLLQRTFQTREGVASWAGPLIYLMPLILAGVFTLSFNLVLAVWNKAHSIKVVSRQPINDYLKEVALKRQQDIAYANRRAAERERIEWEMGAAQRAKRDADAEEKARIELINFVANADLDKCVGSDLHPVPGADFVWMLPDHWSPIKYVGFGYANIVGQSPDVPEQRFNQMEWRWETVGHASSSARGLIVTGLGVPRTWCVAQLNPDMLPSLPHSALVIFFSDKDNQGVMIVSPASLEAQLVRRNFETPYLRRVCEEKCSRLRWVLERIYNKQFYGFGENNGGRFA